MRRVTGEVTILRQGSSGERDPLGNPTPAATVEIRQPVYYIAPAASDEDLSDGRKAVRTGWAVGMPIGADVRPSDRVRLPDGQICHVVGDPAVWDHNPTVRGTSKRGVVVELRRWKEGA